jgi:hypothetical protein
MLALRIQMHLHGSPSVLQRNAVSQRVVYIVHVVILRLQQEDRRRLAGEWRVLKSHLARTPRQTEIGANLGPSNFILQQRSAAVAGYLGQHLGRAQARPGSMGCFTA